MNEPIAKRGRGRPRTKPLPDPNAPKRKPGRPQQLIRDPYTDTLAEEQPTTTYSPYEADAIPRFLVLLALAKQLEQSCVVRDLRIADGYRNVPVPHFNYVIERCLMRNLITSTDRIWNNKSTIGLNKQSTEAYDIVFGRLSGIISDKAIRDLFAP